MAAVTAAATVQKAVAENGKDCKNMGNGDGVITVAMRCKGVNCEFYAVKNGLCSGCGGGMKCKRDGCTFYGVKDGLCSGCTKNLLHWKQFVATPLQFTALNDFVLTDQPTTTKLFQYLRLKKLLLTAEQAYNIVSLYKKSKLTQTETQTENDAYDYDMEVRLWDAVCCRVYDWKTLRGNHGREGYYEAAATTPLDWDYFAPLSNNGIGRDADWEFQ
jgi:hypothetical protein